MRFKDWLKLDIWYALARMPILARLAKMTQDEEQRLLPVALRQ
jgi:Na+/melibiose symporter-like transporter